MDMTLAQMQRIVIIQYVNIALVLVFAEFSLGSDVKGGQFAVLKGKYRDFDSDWYFSVGAKISVAMISNSIACFTSRFIQPIVQSIIRWLNRGCKKHLRKLTNWQEERKEQFEEEYKKKVEERRAEHEANKGGKKAGGDKP